MTTKRKIAILLLIIPLLPNCGKLVDWGKSNFYQGKKLSNKSKIVQKYIRSRILYDQLDTSASFDVLWLSDSVRSVYAQLHALRYGKNEEQKNVFLRRQLEENKHFISFYVLSLYEVPIGDTNTAWSIFLRIKNDNYLPTEVRSVDLPPEYREFFGTKFTRFKVAYQVKFDAKDIEDNLLLGSDVDLFSIYFRSVDKEIVLTWKLGEKIKPLA